MKRVVFTIFLSISVVLIAPNPVPQISSSCTGQNWPTFQQHPNSLAPCYQEPTSQTNSYSQTSGFPQKTSNLGFDGPISQLLINKIFENSCIQKLLDPNTKLYNQNGQEIQRHPNPGTAPNVINNYFIVPPELFNLNNITTDGKSQNSAKIKTSNGKKPNKNKIKKNLTIIDGNSMSIKEKQQNSKTKARRFKNGQNNDQYSAKTIDNNITSNNDDKCHPDLEGKKNKKKRKQESKNKKRLQSVISPSDVEEQYEIGQKSRKTTNDTDGKISSTITKFENSDISMRDDKSAKKKKSKIVKAIEDSLSIKEEEEKSNIKKEFKNLKKSKSQLKNIESPVDDRETLQDLTENRKTRNSKNNKGKKDDKAVQTFALFPDDVYRSLFPYLYLNNYFYPNSNFPFNYEQIYKPYSNTNNDRNKKHKNKKKPQNNKETLPNIVEVPITIKSKKKETTSIALNNTISAENGEKEIETPLEVTSGETTTLFIESTSSVSTETPYEITSIPSTDNEIESETPNKVPILTKSNLEMPPTVIEDLHDFIIPELTREDIIPTIHTKGLIHDYYPIFYDDSYYSNDETYYLGELEDDRHFYSTDPGHEQLLNRDRRKYDKNENLRSSSLDIRNRINFRRGYKYAEPEEIKIGYDDNSIQKPDTHAKLIENKTLLPKSETKIQFYTPSKLENPDFRTKKIEIDRPNDQRYINIAYDPVYTSFSSGDVPESSTTYFDTKDTALNRMVNADTDIRKEIVPSKNVRPKNDHIETVFAKTKVVKYGVAKDESQENNSIPMPANEAGNGNNFISDGHTTFVVAKSLGQVDDYYW